MRQQKNSPNKSRPIRSHSLLDAMDKHGGSNRDLAYNAGVSFRAIAEARKGFDPAVLRNQPRKRVGIIESATRLAICLELDPRAVLRELGINPEDTTIRRYVERARESAAPRVLQSGDYVIQAIRAREHSSSKGPLLGIAPWSPFTDGLIGGASVAHLLARSVLGSLNPAWDRDRNISLEFSFAEAERRLLSGGPGTPEMVLGLYDLPWRRQEGVELVPLPGLRVKAGGLCTRPIDWNEIFTPPGEKLPRAWTIDGDVGDKLLSGPVDYPVGRLIKPPLSTHDPREVAQRIAKEKRSGKSDLLFIADGPLVKVVSRHLGELGIQLHQVQGDEWAPSYGFGFALRRDSSHFQQLLQSAIDQDLLGRTFPRTVNLYLKLLESGSNEIGLMLSELEDRYPHGASRFLASAKEFYALDWKNSADRLRAVVIDKHVLEHLASRSPTGARNK